MKGIVLFVVLLAIVGGFTAAGSNYGEQDEKKKKLQSASSGQTKQATAFLTKSLIPGIINTTNTELFYSIKGRYMRAVTKDKLSDANLLNDIIPFYPLSWITTYQEVEISTDYKGQKTKAVSKNNILSTEQKNILQSAELASKIEITVKYSTINSVTGNSDSRQMDLSLTVIPEKEAEYPGGYDQIIGYIKENSNEKISGLNPETFQNASILFNISEEGKITDLNLVKTSGYTEIDNLLLELIGKMPAWKPAENAKGLKVKQEFEFAFGPSGC